MHPLTPNATPHSHTRLLLVEPASLVRSCLQALLAQIDDVEVAGAVSAMREGTSLAEAFAPDIMLVNIKALVMTGFEALRHLRSRCPGTRLLMIVAGNSDQAMEEALCAGADGFVNISATLEELRAAIRLALTSGKQPERTAPGANGSVRDRYAHAPTRTAAVRLTARENEVLKLIASGRTNKAIAAYLCLSISTIERHRTNLIRKLDLHNAAALTAYAIRAGLVTIDRNTLGLVDYRPSAS
jgi:two-component system response regulator NreC